MAIPSTEEIYLYHFWNPKPGNMIFRTDNPEEAYQITMLETDYPNQALVQNVKTGFRKAVFLQDFMWAPQFGELDDMLEKLDVTITDDGMIRNQKWIQKPKTLKQYCDVFRTIRLYGLQEGKDLMDVFRG